MLLCEREPELIHRVIKVLTTIKAFFKSSLSHGKPFKNGFQDHAVFSNPLIDLFLTVRQRIKDCIFFESSDTSIKLQSLITLIINYNPIIL